MLRPPMLVIGGPPYEASRLGLQPLRPRSLALPTPHSGIRRPPVMYSPAAAWPRASTITAIFPSAACLATISDSESPIKAAGFRWDFPDASFPRGAVVLCFTGSWSSQANCNGLAVCEANRAASCCAFRRPWQTISNVFKRLREWHMPCLVQ
jgi:hypothetical protein